MSQKSIYKPKIAAQQEFTYQAPQVDFILSFRGRPVPGVHVTVHAEGHEPIAAVTGEDGTIKLFGVSGEKARVAFTDPAQVAAASLAITVSQKIQIASPLPRAMSLLKILLNNPPALLQQLETHYNQFHKTRNFVEDIVEKFKGMGDVARALMLTAGIDVPGYTLKHDTIIAQPPYPYLPQGTDMHYRLKDKAEDCFWFRVKRDYTSDRDILQTQGRLSTHVKGGEWKILTQPGPYDQAEGTELARLPGNFVNYCVDRKAKTIHLHEQCVTKLEDILDYGKRRFPEMLPEQAVGLYRAHIAELEKEHPKTEKITHQIEHTRKMADKIEAFVQSAKDKDRITIDGYYVAQAPYADAAQQFPVMAFLCKKEDGAKTIWELFDWTQPLDDRTHGLYRGEGPTDQDAIRAAIRNWQDHNSYYDGVIAVDVPVYDIQEEFHTPGKWSKAVWADYLAFASLMLLVITPFGLAGAIGAGLRVAMTARRAVATTLAVTAVPGAASSVLYLYDRGSKGIKNGNADIIDYASLASDVLGMKWAVLKYFVRENRITGAMQQMALIGQIAGDSVVGFLITMDAHEQIKNSLYLSENRSDEDIRGDIIKLCMLTAFMDGLVLLGTIGNAREIRQTHKVTETAFAQLKLESEPQASANPHEPLQPDSATLSIETRVTDSRIVVKLDEMPENEKRAGVTRIREQAHEGAAPSKSSIANPEFRDTLGSAGIAAEHAGAGQAHLKYIFLGQKVLDDIPHGKLLRDFHATLESKGKLPHLNAEMQKLMLEYGDIYAKHNELLKSSNIVKYARKHNMTEAEAQTKKNELEEKVEANLARTKQLFDETIAEKERLIRQAKFLFQKMIYKKFLTPTDAAELAAKVTVTQAVIEVAEKKGITKENIMEGLTLFYKLVTQHRPDPEKIGLYTSKKRAKANPAGILDVGDEPNTEVLLHEMTHYIEFTHRDIGKAAKAFVQARARHEGDTRSFKLKEEIPLSIYDPDETAYRGNFWDPYVGKWYDDDTSEVVTMGVQEFRSAEGMFNLFLHDPEHFFFVLGVIRGVHS